MTTGAILKQKLGLNKLKYVQIARLIISTVPTYIIYYDSYRISFPITTFRVKKAKHPSAMLYNGTMGFKKKPPMTPLMDIETYNGNISGHLFMLVDLAGSNMVNKSRSLESNIKSFYKTKLKEITLFDLRDKDATVSSFTKKFIKQRRKLNKGANANTKLISVDINGKDILFKFLAESTDNSDEFKREVNPNTFEIQNNPSRTYELWLNFSNAIDLLDLQDKDTITRLDVKALLELSDVELWNNSPSFQYQSFNWNNTQLDSSIFPTNIAPKQWDKILGGNYFLDKHLAGLVNQIGFFLNPMSSMLTKILKDKGYLPK